MNSTIKCMIYFAVSFVVSCTQPSDMLTVIKPNGSCYREFTASANPQFLFGDTTAKMNPFPVEIDSTWKVSWKYKNSKLRTDFPISKAAYDSIIKNLSQTKEIKIQNATSENASVSLTVFARKSYKSVDEMATKFKLKRSHEWSNMKVKYSLEKKFRWFYTYYTYREIYPKIMKDFEIPIEKYMTKDEAQFWFTGNPNIVEGMNGVEIREYIGEIEDNYNKWFGQNAWDAEYKILINNYTQIINKPVTKERLKLLKDTIFKSNTKEFPDFNMEKILNNYFKTEAFSTLWKGENSPMKKFEDDFNNQGFIKYVNKSFTYKLIMPGKVIPPNNAVIHGDTLVWKLTAYRMIPGNYAIDAQSRKANIWAFILTGIIMIVAIGSFFWKPKKH
jgi:hypothetical protein